MRKFGLAELKLRLALNMESKSKGFPQVFHRCSWLRKFGLAELKLRLALSVKSKSNCFPFSIGAGGSDNSDSPNLSLGGLSEWKPKSKCFPTVFHRRSWLRATFEKGSGSV